MLASNFSVTEQQQELESHILGVRKSIRKRRRKMMINAASSHAIHLGRECWTCRKFPGNDHQSIIWKHIKKAPNWQKVVLCAESIYIWPAATTCAIGCVWRSHIKHLIYFVIFIFKRIVPQFFPIDQIAYFVPPFELPFGAAIRGPWGQNSGLKCSCLESF